MMKFYAQGETEKVLLKKENNGKYLLSKDFLIQNKKFSVSCDVFTAKKGEKGFYLLPPNIHSAGAPLVKFTAKTDGEYTVKNALLSFFGVSDEKFCCIVFVDRCYIVSYRVKVENGVYSLFIDCDLTNQIVDEDMVLCLLALPVNSDYNAMAKAARQWYVNSGVPTLKERCENREAVEYARRHPLIRIRMGWKPVFPTVLHQTLENEPEMFVACTFSRVRDIADELKKQGIEGAELSLVGWNVRGHDGRWPQVFPVEEALGGEEELKKTIEYCNARGYRVTCHTNSLDHYEIADSFSQDNLSRNVNGDTYTSGDWGGGTSYRACPKIQLEYAKRDLPEVAQLGFRGIHYIDVLSIVEPDCCFAQSHPCTMREAFNCYDEIMKLSSELFGGFSSEGCMDFTFRYLDFSLYNNFQQFPGTPQGMVDEYIPLTEMVAHGLILSNQSCETINYIVKGKENRLTALLFGCRPAFYFYSRFISNGKNWMGEDDLTCKNDAELKKSVTAIKDALSDYSYFADKQFVFIERFDNYGNGVYGVTYEDGDRILVNYSDKDTVVENVCVRAKEHIVIIIKA